MEQDESVVVLNQAEIDEIDMIISKREKKISVEVPHVNYSRSGSSIRKVYLKDSEYHHLYDEVKGGKYGEPSRPEISVYRVGVGAKVEKKKKKKGVVDNRIPRDMSKGNGVEILYDSAKKLYILNESCEDRLILLVRNDPEKAAVVNSVVTYNGPFEYSYVDNFVQRAWRRFLSLHILPLLKSTKRMKDLQTRFIASLGLEGNPDEDNDDDEDKTKKSQKKLKKSKSSSRNRTLSEQDNEIIDS